MSSVVWHYWTEKTDLTTTKYNGIKAFLKSHFNLVPSLWIWGKNNSYHQGEWGVISSRGINPISKGGLISESAVGCHQLSGTTGPKKQIFLLQSTMKPKSFWSRIWIFTYYFVEFYCSIKCKTVFHFGQTTDDIPLHCLHARMLLTCPRSEYKNCPRRGGGGQKISKFCPCSWMPPIRM